MTQGTTSAFTRGNCCGHCRSLCRPRSILCPVQAWQLLQQLLPSLLLLNWSKTPDTEPLAKIETPAIDASQKMDAAVEEISQPFSCMLRPLCWGAYRRQKRKNACKYRIQHRPKCMEVRVQHTTGVGVELAFLLRTPSNFDVSRKT